MLGNLGEKFTVQVAFLALFLVWLVPCTNIYVDYLFLYRHGLLLILPIPDQKSYSRHHVPCMYSLYRRVCVCVCVFILWVRVVLVNLASHVGLVLYVYIIPTCLPPQVGGSYH